MCWFCKSKTKNEVEKGKNINSGCNCHINFRPCECANIFGGKKLLRQNPTSQRIKYLAKPTKRTKKFNKCGSQKFRRQIEIVREPKISTRLEQLAIRPVRHLISTRDENKSFMHPIRYNRFNRAIHKSMFTMYSRLANVQLPPTKEPPKKWTQQDWDRHNAWLAEKALPKKVIRGPKPERLWKPLEEMNRIEELAKPKILQKKYTGSNTTLNNIYRVKQSAIDYEASKRICTLSVPKYRTEKGKKNECDKTGVSRGAMRYKPTERIETLSQPKKYKNAESDQKENPFSVSPNALKAKPSERIIELAKPKQYEGS